ncbi:MAG: prolipoprotein diacylglyceryl transferase [Clostridiales bacterium]|nr:prolipoprotein diacylglyceryl transferase [Clostridiales bacterium]
MKVDLFSIGRFTVHSYGLMIAIGIILAVIIAMKRAAGRKLVADEVLNISIIIVVFGFLGAKILFVLENFKQFLVSPMSVIGSSGFVVYGGICIGLFCVFAYCRWIRKVSFLRYVDLVFPCVALGQAFGRLGCFMAGCCYGKETTAWWGVTFPEGSFAPAGVPLIPTQLISAIGDFVIFLVLIWFTKKAKKVGDVTALYLLLYGAGRFCVEFLRQNEQGGIGPLTTAQCFSICFIAASIILFMLNRKMPYSANYAEVLAEKTETDSTEESEDNTDGEHGELKENSNEDAAESNPDSDEE